MIRHITWHVNGYTMVLPFILIFVNWWQRWLIHHMTSYTDNITHNIVAYNRGHWMFYNPCARAVYSNCRCEKSTSFSQQTTCKDQLHDDVIKWKYFFALLSFCTGNSPVKGQWRGALMFSLICALNKRLSKQSLGWWFGTPSRSLWRHCNVMSVIQTSEWTNQTTIGSLNMAPVRFL